MGSPKLTITGLIDGEIFNVNDFTSNRSINYIDNTAGASTVTMVVAVNGILSSRCY